MSRNRYVSDYRIVESIDGRGRVRTDFEYIGAPWYYAEGAATVRTARRIVTACCPVGWAAWLIALTPRSAATRALYTALPFVFAAVPMALNTALTLRLLRQKEPFEHRHADQLENRGPACSFLVILLSAIALIGEAVNALRGAGWLTGDGVFCACTVILAACGLASHRQWKGLKCREGAK